ncbi:S41 family peptidase [Clostridiisalibacter paucivorans]|uniref:S41 family peptidase n=1 Tax=Clostridiisalibacter paucivorans TaxID=408753 RepID=UPI00047D2BFD|nr:S41 family peptidase [Clostridiisalibacter paucivorans]
MISKRKAVLWSVILVFISSIVTFTVGNIIQISVGDKVIIAKREVNKLTNTYEKYAKAMALENFINENYLNDISEKEMMDGQLKGMFESLDDPYSVYMTEDEFNNFMEHTKGSYGGIGVIVTPGEDNMITVVSPIEDTPGYRAGFKPGDKIIKVNGEEFTADKLDDAIKIMKGEPGTEVNITVMRRDGEGKPNYIEMPITREEIRLESIKSKMLSDDIGYIRIIQFDELVYDDFIEHYEALKNEGMKGLIIDLRNNPGGLLDKCVDIADKLIGKSVVVYTETKSGDREYFKSDSDKINIPYTVLINEGSASASEILAGAVKDTKSGTLIGTKSFGKGIVQRINQLPDGSGFKLTVSKYFTPNGVSIHGEGITPDIIVPIPEDVDQIGLDNLNQDTQLKKAIEEVKEKMNH